MKNITGKTIGSVLGIIGLVVGTNLVVDAVKPNSGTDKTAQSSTSNSVYNRVIASGKIRCGYVVYPPGLNKDPKTGKFSGISYDAIEQAAKNLKLKVEWTEEVGWGTMIEGLQSDRYDAICSPVWANTTRGKLVDFSVPLFYSGIGAYVRSGDTKFNNLKALDNSGIKIATMDGEMSDIIAQAQFPKAQKVSLPQNSDVSQLLLNVSQNKADVTFVEPFFGAGFMKSNPGALKNIALQRPIRVFGNTMMFKRGETEFKQMMNSAFEELLNQGYVDDLISKYEPFPGAFYRAQQPYRVDGIPNVPEVKIPVKLPEVKAKAK
jgi:polar amino acid transport system substrate-binding protein